MTRFRHLIRVTFSFLTLLLLTTPPVSALDCVDYTDYLHLAGSLHHVGLGAHIATQGDVAYVGTSQYLKIVDVSDPENPIELATIGQLGSKHVTPAGDLAYVGYVGQYGSLRGFHIIDIADPATPALLSTTDTSPGVPGPAVLSGDHLFVTTTAGLHVYEIGDPAAPALVGIFPAIAGAIDMILNGSIAYLTGDSELRTVDLSDPTAPALLGSLPSTHETYGLDLTGDELLVASATTYTGELLAFDVSAPGTPTLLGSVYVPGFLRGVCRLGDRAFVASEGNDLQLVDLSDSAAPVHLGHLSLTDWPVDVALVGDQVCVASHNDAYNASSSTLSVVDASRPDFVPIDANELDGAALAMTIVGEHAILAAGEDDLLVVDLSDPTAPGIVAEVDFLGSALDLTVQGGVAYVAAGSGGLQIVSVSDPTAPYHVQGLLLAADAKDIAVEAGVAYLILSDYTIAAVDISSPGLPSLLTTFDPGNGVWPEHLDVANGILYLGGAEKAWVVDASDPTAMSVAGTFNPILGSATMYPVCDEGRLIIAQRAGWQEYCGSSVKIYDLSDPLAPDLLGGVGLPTCSMRDIAIDGDIAYAATGSVYAVDISDPEAPVFIGQIGGARATSIAVGADLLAMSFDEDPDPDTFATAPLHCAEPTAVPEDAVGPAPGRLAVHPNPFNPTTFVDFALPVDGRARLSIHGVDGRRVRDLLDAELPAGDHRAEWDGRDDAGRAQSSGVYLLRYAGPGMTAQEKLVLLR